MQKMKKLGNLRSHQKIKVCSIEVSGSLRGEVHSFLVKCVSPATASCTAGHFNLLPFIVFRLEVHSVLATEEKEGNRLNSGLARMTRILGILVYRLRTNGYFIRF